MKGGPRCSLNLASRAGGGHTFGTLYRGRSGDAEIVGRGPQPETSGLSGIRQDGQLNVGLPGRIDVVGSIVGAVREVDMLHGKRLRNALDIGEVIDFHVDGEGVAVENRRL